MDLTRTGIPKRFWGKTLDDYRVEPGLEEAFEATATYINNLSERRATGQGLLYVGPPGWGKTLLACIVALTARDAGSDARYTTFAGYIKLLLNAMDLKSGWQKRDDLDAWNDWCQTTAWTSELRNNVDFLVCDDVGKEHTTNTRFAEDEFDFLIRHRFDLGLPSILTSNVPIAEWAGRYTDSMQSFVAEAFQIIRVGGEGDDFRWRRH